MLWLFTLLARPRAFTLAIALGATVGAWTWLYSLIERML